jgi:serine protease Do
LFRRIRASALAVPLIAVLVLQAQSQSPTGQVAPQALSATFSEVTRRVESAVVNIDAKSKRGSVGQRRPPQRNQTAVGSGFVVDPTGHIITNHHVVEDASRITVRFRDGEELVAEIVGFDEETDIAVLKVDAGRPLPSLKFGDSDAARVGDWVLALGSPFGLEQTVTAGIVSQVKRETPYGSVFQKFIQTDAAINRGNSGGPLVNLDGEVVGVNSQIATSTGDYNGIGFALPSNDARSVYEQILSDGRVRRGFLGVGLESVREEFAKVYGLPEARGAIVVDIRDRQSAAAKAGLEVGDVIVEVNGRKIDGATDMISKVASVRPDDKVDLVFWREVGTEMEKKFLSVKLAERPGAGRSSGDAGVPADVGDANRDASSKPFGLTLEDIDTTSSVGDKFSGTRGIIVREVHPDSFIIDVKLRSGADAVRRGDVIQKINRVIVSDVKMFSEFVATLKKGDPVVLQIISNDASQRLTQTKIVQFTVK